LTPRRIDDGVVEFNDQPPTTRHARRCLQSRLFANVVEVTTRSDESLITLIRHGESDWNELGLIQGQDNRARLTVRGRIQAQSAAETIRQLNLDYLVTSDLERARETADIIGAAIGLLPTADAMLRERCFGVFEGRPIGELTPELTGLEHHVIVNPDARPPGGESFNDVVARASLVIKRLRDERAGQRGLIVCHGITIRALRASVSEEPLEGSSWYAVNNCSVWSLAAHNSESSPDQ
jgi:broad specificity phosphatase PhoE